MIESVTFRDCIFMDCVMGFLSFRHVHIDRCRFVRCDFSRTEFVECIVDEHCEFEGCSADDCRVQCTELRPQTFLKGMPFQEQNLSVLPGDERQKQRSLWLNNTARLAGQLLRSNRDVANRAYEDEAVFLERRASLALPRGAAGDVVARWERPSRALTH
ncbi:MAG: hypothetical protein R3F39_20710 [Myxococcota bacterium]